MTTDKNLEDLLGQVRLRTTAEQDERILGDALAAIDRPGVSSPRTLPRNLRRHWRLSAVVVCVLVLLIVLPLTLPRTLVEDSGPVREVALVTNLPEDPAPSTPHIKQRDTTHHAIVAPAAPSLNLAVQQARTRQRGAVHSYDRRAPNEKEKAKTEAEAKKITEMAAARDVAGLVKMLSVAEFVNQVAAAEHLTDIGDGRALAELKTLNTSHGNWWIAGDPVMFGEHDRSSAAFAWAIWSIVHRDLPQPKQIEGLFDLLEGKGPAVPEDVAERTAHFNFNVGKRVGEKLETYEDPAVAARLRQTKNKGAAISAVKMEVRSMDNEAARARCVQISQDEDGAGRYGAIQVLGTFDRKAFSDLDLLARQGHDEAIRVLGYRKQDTPEALERICWHLTNNSTYKVRLVATKQFYTVTDRPGVVPALAKALYDPRKEIRKDAAQLLWIAAVHAKSPHLEELEEAMLVARNHPDEDVRKHAIKALKALGSKRLDEPLTDPPPVRTKISQPAAAAEPNEVVDGVQVRLRARQVMWKENTTGHLVADLRNQGTRNLIACPFLYACELEVDGQWYRRPQHTHEARQRPKPFPPGRQYDKIAINLDEWWEPKAPRNVDAPRDAESERLKLTPGKHTIRVAFTASPAKDTPGKNVRAISNPVEIEVIAAEEVTEDVGAAPWGEAVDGLRAAFELVPEKETYALGERIGVRLHVKNVSNDDVPFSTLSTRQDYASVRDSDGKNVEVRKKWHTGIVSTVRHVLKPGQILVLKTSGLSFGTFDDPALLTRPKGPWVGSVVQSSPGQYAVTYPVSRTLKTGVRNVTVTDRPAVNPRTFELTLDGQAMWQAVNECARKYRARICFEEIMPAAGPAAPQHVLTGTFAGPTMPALLDKLTEQGPYTWEKHNRTYVVYPKEHSLLRFFIKIKASAGPLEPVVRAVLDLDPKGKQIEIDAVYTGPTRNSLWISKHYAMYALSNAVEGAGSGDILWTLRHHQGVPCLALHRLALAGRGSVKAEAESPPPNAPADGAKAGDPARPATSSSEAISPPEPPAATASGIPVSILETPSGNCTSQPDARRIG